LAAVGRSLTNPGQSKAISDPLTASDFWPLILKLPHEELLRLAKLTLRVAATDSSATSYAAAPPAADELSSDNQLLAWESEGWRRDEIRWYTFALPDERRPVLNTVIARWLGKRSAEDVTELEHRARAAA
jgi:hypothetical protein